MSKIKQIVAPIAAKLRDPKVLGQLRHLLSTLGGALAAKGVITSTDYEMYIGLGMAALALVLSLTAPEKAK